MQNVLEDKVLLPKNNGVPIAVSEEIPKGILRRIHGKKFNNNSRKDCNWNLKINPVRIPDENPEEIHEGLAEKGLREISEAISGGIPVEC